MLWVSHLCIRLKAFENTWRKCTHQSKAFENMKHPKPFDPPSWGDPYESDGDLLLRIMILYFHSFCLCRFHFPIPQTPGHCLQNYILAWLLQQLPQPHHLPLLQSGVQEGLPERSPWPLPQQNAQDLEPSGLCSRPYAWPQICSGFPIYICWLPEAY